MDIHTTTIEDGDTAMMPLRKKKIIQRNLITSKRQNQREKITKKMEQRKRKRRARVLLQSHPDYHQNFKDLDYLQNSKQVKKQIILFKK
jgi:hypothetical protein